jgi:hypothetical protein
MAVSFAVPAGSPETNIHSVVVARLVRAIHVFFLLNPAQKKKNVDGPQKAGHDELREGA